MLKVDGSFCANHCIVLFDLYKIEYSQNKRKKSKIALFIRFALRLSKNFCKHFFKPRKNISRLFSEKPAVSLEAVAAGAAIGAGGIIFSFLELLFLFLSILSPKYFLMNTVFSFFFTGRQYIF